MKSSTKYWDWSWVRMIIWKTALSSCVRSHSMRSRIMPKTGRHSSYTGNLYRLHLVMLTIIINTVFRCRIFKTDAKSWRISFCPNLDHGQSGKYSFDSTDESVGKDATNANYKTLKGFNTSDFGNRYYMTGNFYGSFSKKTLRYFLRSPAITGFTVMS